MNFRVHLQYEFSQLGLDDYLEKLRNTESEELQVGQLCNFSRNYPTIMLIHYVTRYKYLPTLTTFSTFRLW